MNKAAKTIHQTLDLENLPPLTAKQKTELASLQSLSDGEIDTSEVPVLPSRAWDDATRGRFYKPIKLPTTVRVDADVLAWLRSQGTGYQTRINAILRDAMLKALRR
jgi:uncharacterized protein (DUF4415 family)